MISVDHRLAEGERGPKMSTAEFKNGKGYSSIYSEKPRPR